MGKIIYRIGIPVAFLVLQWSGSLVWVAAVADTPATGFYEGREVHKHWRHWEHWVRGKDFLLAPSTEQNLVTFLCMQKEHRLWVGREGRWAHSGPRRESTVWYRLERWEQHTEGLARGSMVQEGGGRKAAEVSSSLILPGAKDFSHRQPVLVVPPPLTGLSRSSSPLVSDLFIAQKGFDLWKFLSFPGLVCWICIAKCSIQNCHPMPTFSHFSNTFLKHRSQFLQRRKPVKYRLT